MSRLAAAIAFLTFIPVILIYPSESETICIQRPVSGDRAYIALGNDHKYRRERDKQQFDMLVKIVEDADAEVIANGSSSIPYYIFVEHAFPHILTIIKREGYKIYPRITAGLVPLTRQKPFRRSVVVNCEVRKKSGAAEDMLNLARYALEKNKPLEEERAIRSLEECASLDPVYLKHCAQEYDCQLGQLTFKDVFDEFDELFKMAISYRDTWSNPIIMKIFDRSLDECLFFIKQLKNAIVDHNELVIKFSRELILSEKPQKEKEWFASAMRDAFAGFVDIFIIHHILLLQKKPVEKVIYCVGRSHSDHISEAFRKLGSCTLFPSHARSQLRQNLYIGAFARDHLLLVSKPFGVLNRECVQKIKAETEQDEEDERFMKMVKRLSFI